MGNWSAEQKEKSENNERAKNRREKLAVYFFDLSKLVFVALVLGGIIALNTEGSYFQKYIFFQIILGLSTTIFLAFYR